MTKIKYKKLIPLLLPPLIIVSGILVYFILIYTKPAPARTQRAQQALLVEVSPATLISETAKIEALGIVKPAVEISLQSRVTGEVLEVHRNFVPGGTFKKGEVLLQLDPTDLRLALNQRMSELETAKANLQIELGNQAIAEAEYKLLAETLEETDLSLVLRQPQINIIQAQIKAAQASVEKARLDLERSTIIAPFNGTVINRTVETGAQVLPGTSFGTFVGTDRYWIEAKLPLEQLQWINLPQENQKGSKVLVYNPDAWNNTQYIEGYISHVSKNLEDSGRLLSIFIEIESPLESLKNKNFQLFLNAYVRLHIEGKKLENVIALSREHLRSNSQVWIMNSSSQLEIRKVQSSFKTKEFVYIDSGIQEGELLITSNITTPISNMPLRTIQTLNHENINTDKPSVVTTEGKSKP